MRKAGRIDANQPELVEFFRKAGATVDVVSGVPNLGYDLVLSFQGQVVLVEVKDGSKPPSKRTLTDSELEAQRRHGSVYAVVESIEDAQKVLRRIAAQRIKLVYNS